jgi:hypothetical protein
MLIVRVTLIAAACVATAAVAAVAGQGKGWKIDLIGSMHSPRAVHQVRQVGPDKFLIAGGCAQPSCESVQASNEFYDAAKNSFSPAPSMRTARVSHGMATLPNGDILVVGGWTGQAATTLTEIFHIKSSSFSAGPAMATPRMDPVVAAIGDGLVLVAGGATSTNQPVASVEIFSAVDSKFVAAKAMTEPRVSHAGVALPDGRILIVGGLRARNTPTSSAEVFDPRSGTFTAVGAMNGPRYKHAAVLLRDGRVMVIGGSAGGDERNRLNTTEIFDPKKNTFTAGPSMRSARYKIPDSAAVLPDGSVVITGGAKDAEIWHPGAAAFVSVAGTVGATWAFSTATALQSGDVLVVGGYDDLIRPTNKAWILKMAVN